METLMRRAREVGTSAGVLLPRKWLNKQVVVTIFPPSKADIAKDILDIFFKQNLNEEIKGIYLFGSYARGDHDFNSDIDVLVITQKLNKLITHGNYEVLLVSEHDFSKNLSTNLNYLSILKEMKIIINNELIKKYSSIKHKFNIKKILTEIKSIIKINEDSLNLCKDNKQDIPDGIAYSIVLRLRELYLIKCLLSNKEYHKEDFLKITGENNYLAYNRIKRNEKELNNSSFNELKNILDLSKKWLKELKS